MVDPARYSLEGAHRCSSYGGRVTARRAHIHERRRRPHQGARAAHRPALESFAIGGIEDHVAHERPRLHGALASGQGRRIHVPRADHLKPNRDFLAERYALFRRAS